MRSVVATILLLTGHWIEATGAEQPIPVIYSTDLHHPHVDPDDHFDLATLFALPELDVQALVLDCGAHQKKASGSVPVNQLKAIVGRDIVTAIGLATPLQSPDDDGRHQPEEFQRAVSLILATLEKSPTPVTIFTTGSLRDVAAAINRDADLLKRKVSRLYVNIGNPATGNEFADDEYNVGLDRNAYIRVMNSGLPVYWCPCFDGQLWHRGRHGTYWKFKQSEVLESAPTVVQNFFIFALTKPAGVNPVDFLHAPQLTAARSAVWQMTRNMWCTAPLIHAAGRTIQVRGENDWEAVPAGNATSAAVAAQSVGVFGFTPVRLEATQTASSTVRVTFAPDGESQSCVFEVGNDQYERVMTACLKHLLSGIRTPSPAPPSKSSR